MGTISTDQYRKTEEVSAVLNQSEISKDLIFINYLKAGRALENKKDFKFDILQTRHKRRIAGAKSFGATATMIRKDKGQLLTVSQMHKKEDDSVIKSEIIRGLYTDPKTGKPMTEAQAIGASRAIVKDKCLARDELSMAAIVTIPTLGQDITIAGIDEIPVAMNWLVPGANALTATIPWNSSGADPSADLTRAIILMKAAGITDIAVFYSPASGAVIHSLIKRNSLTVDQKMLTELTWGKLGIVPDGAFGLRWNVHDLTYENAGGTEVAMFPDGQISLVPVKAFEAFRYWQGLNMITGGFGFGGREYRDDKQDALVTEGDLVSIAGISNPWGIVNLSIYTP